MNWHRLMRIYAIITAVGAYVMVLLGAVVTNTNSGQGCGGSWPFCHGQLLPDSMTLSAAYEYSHRVASSADGFLILTLTIWAFLAYRRDFRVKLFAAMSLFFVVLQGILGAVTVVYEGTFAKYPLLALHFGFALISFASVILLTIRLFQSDREKREGPRAVKAAGKGLQYAIWGLAAYTYVVVYTGALVQHTGALLGCGMQFPGCGSTYLPNLSSTAGIQLLHRFAAASIWLLILAFLIVVMLRYREHRDIVSASWWAFALVTLQAASGAMTVLSGGVLMVSLVHTTIIAGLYSVLCYLCAQVGWPWKKREREDVQVAAEESNVHAALRT